MRNQANPWITSNLPLLVAAMLPAILLIGALLYFTAWAFTFSFTDLALVGKKAVDWSWVGLQNFERLFTRKGFLELLWTTIIFVFFSAIVGQSVIGFLLALALRNRYSTLKTVVEVCIMLGWLLPDIVAAFLWSATTSQTGLINALIVVPLGFKPINFINEFALPIVTIANIWKGTAWSYLLFSAALNSVSREIVEAAKIDGATGFQRIWMVILPIIRPHIATNMLFITIWTFTYFPLIFAMTGGGPGRQTETLAVFLYNQSFARGNLGFGSAISVAMLVIVGTLSIVYLRMLREPR